VTPEYKLSANVPTAPKESPFVRQLNIWQLGNIAAEAKIGDTARPKTLSFVVFFYTHGEECLP
jgi:hypothetical protein